MDKIRANWSGELPAFPEAEIGALSAAAAPELLAVCGCFWLFRFLHRAESPAAALLGDYCFGRFSHHLAALDSVSLTDAFSAWLREDTLAEKDFGDYLDFVRELPRTVKYEHT